MDEIKNFANSLSASMAGLSNEDYINKMIEDASVLDGFKAQTDKVCKIAITPENFNSFRAFNGEMTSLYCFMHNNNFSSEKIKTLLEIQAKLNKHMVSAARKLSRRNSNKEVLPILKYATGASRYYRDENFQATMNVLLNTGLLFKKPYVEDGKIKYHFVANGMHLAVGDNCFGVSRRSGKEYRLYVDVIVPMAFPVSLRYRKVCEDMLDKIPTLPECYEVFYIDNDRKNCSKVSISYSDRQAIQSFVVRNMQNA